MAASKFTFSSALHAGSVNGSSSPRWRNAGFPVRTQDSSSFQAFCAPSPATSMTIARALPGASAQALAERGERDGAVLLFRENSGMRQQPQHAIERRRVRPSGFGEVLGMPGTIFE